MDLQPTARPADDHGQAGLHAQIAALTAQVEELTAARARAEAAGAMDASEVAVRFRNLLANLRSVFARTAEASQSAEDVAIHFTGRFDALAEFGPDMLAGLSVELEDVIREQLLKFGESDGSRTTIAGPPVLLTFRQVSLVGLTIHELATNAIKFGALMIEDAHLSISWTFEDESRSRIRLVWAETDVPVILSAPVTSGFGREFIEQALPYQLGARTAFHLRPGGLCCEISLPIADHAPPSHAAPAAAELPGEEINS